MLVGKCSCELSGRKLHRKKKSETPSEAEGLSKLSSERRRPLEIEAEDSVPFSLPGRVPHVCVGVAGALHGLNKTGRSPFECSLLCAITKQPEGPSSGEPNDAKPRDLRFSFLPN
jgi:hypothetical protein